MPRHSIITAIAALVAASTANPLQSQGRIASNISRGADDVIPPTTGPISHIVNSRFEDVGRSGVPAMHAALLQNGQVVFLDKVETYTELKLDNDRYAFSSIYDPDTHNLTPLRVRSNAFCSGGAFLSDGRLLNVGGNFDLNWLDPTVDNGLDAVRYLDLEVLQHGWTENGNKLSSKRWYPSVQVLSDGSIFVASGSLNALDVLNKSNNNPTYEVLDKMYPFLHLMNDGSLFVFVSKSSELFDVARNKTLKRMPDLKGLYRTYPNTGGSVMLPLSSTKNYSPTIMICGGGGWQDLPSPADSSCGIIDPMSESPQWTYTSMPERRCMVEGILLLDGTVLWVNGAQRGAQGFGIADTPALEALIFDPKDRSWSEAGKSDIARLYHSVALMLLDGTVLIAGSNPNEMPILMEYTDQNNQSKKFPTEFRVERWTPPYLTGQNINQRPTNVQIKKVVTRADEVFDIEFHYQKDVKQTKVVLYQGGFVTHSLHMGQVMVELDFVQQEVNHGFYKLTTKIPAISLAPGPYVVYVIVNGVPGIGQFISLEV